MVSEFKNDILELVKNFDVKHEPLLNFDDDLKECLDDKIKKEVGWNKIAVACRRMIICDRELDLGRGKELIRETRELFNKIKNTDIEKPFEAIRYTNTCGLILYRSGNYLDALDSFSEARELAIKYELQYFIPDTTSNVLRADFEFFAHPLPPKFTEDHIIKLEQKCLEYIEEYNKKIEESLKMKPQPDNEDERLYLIYGHGMASLYHNLGEAYSKALSIRNKFAEDKVGYSQLHVNDIKELDVFVNELCRDDPISSYLNKKFSEDTKQKISKYGADKKSGNDAELLTKALIDDLNKILKEQSLFKEVDFPMERLSEIEQKLIKENPQGEDLIRLNRLLLEDSYSQIVRRELNRHNYLEKSKEQNVTSLGYGNDIGDVYRQLQSKNAISKLDNVDNETKNKYETDILNGNWQRGKQFIYQSRIKNSKTIDDINEWIRKDDFKLDVTDDDKFVLLYNLDSIKYFLINNPNVKSVKIKGDKELDILTIAELKIQIAEDIRNIYSPILYKREVVKLIRNDIALIVDDFLKRGKYPEALNFIEKYNNRSINDLINSEIKDVSREQKDEIVKWKMKILETLNSQKQNGNIKDCEAVLSTKMSSILSDDTDESYLKLIFAYEDILKKPANDGSKNEIINEDLCGGLIDRLKKIPETENTAIIKFLIHNDPLNKQKPPKIYAFYIDRTGMTDIEIDIDLNDFLKEIKASLEKIEKKIKIFMPDDLYATMSTIGKKIDSHLKTNKIKNVYIIPDGELFQVPLHLLSEDGKDLRKNINVYYSPSLIQLLTSNMKESDHNVEKFSYLWFRSPTRDLHTIDDKPCLKKPNAEEITTFECMNATLNSFNEIYEKNKYTHVGFSTHCGFHNNLVTAYVSFIRFYDSFLTTYDILMLPSDYFNHTTIFVGACSGGLSKFTDENEAVGLVTAFLAKKAHSIIAPIWDITVAQHNRFIDLINESEVNQSKAWNISNIVKNLDISDKKSPGCLIPFVQYANLELIENIT